MDIKPSDENSDGRRHRTSYETTLKAIVPDGGWGWVVCISCLFGNMVVGGIMLSYGIILPSVKKHFDEEMFFVSLIGSLMIGITYGSAPIAAALTNRFGLRAVYMIGSALACVSLLVSSFSPNAYVLLLFFGVITGFSLGLVLMPASVACNYYFEKRRTLATGIAKAGMTIGGFVIPLLTDFMLETFDWRADFWVYATMAFTACVFGSFIKPLELVVATNQNNKNEVGENTINKEDADNVNKDPGGLHVISEDSNKFTISTNDRYSDNAASLKENILQPISTHSNISPQIQRRLSALQHQEYPIKSINSIPEGTIATEENVIERSRRRPTLEILEEYITHDEYGNLEFVFKPIKPEGSKLFLPPLARSDSFYDGSLANLFGPVSSHKKTSSALDVETGEIYSVVCMSAFSHRSTEKLFRVKLMELMDPTFWNDLLVFTFFLSRFFGNFSISILFMFLPSIFLQKGFSLEQGTIMLTTIGVSNSVSRVFMGIIMDHPRVYSTLLTGGGFFLQAIILCALPLVEDYKYLLVLGGVIGLTNSPYWVGFSITLGRMLPLEKVASTCGLMSLAQGLGSILGPLTAGLIYDATKSDSIIEYTVATGCVLSGVSCCISSYIHHNRKNNLSALRNV